MIFIDVIREGNKSINVLEDYKLLQLNNSALIHKDSLKTFKIRIDPNKEYSNNYITFHVLNSEYEYKYSKNMDELFNMVRLKAYDIIMSRFI